MLPSPLENLFPEFPKKPDALPGVVAVSHCLLGCSCRYDGVSKPNKAVRELVVELEARGVEVVPVCPERAAGLPIPRLPAERVGTRVVAADGVDVTSAFYRGAKMEAARMCAKGCRFAVLKEKSPSCGTKSIYDGTFSGMLVEGSGIFASLLCQKGVICVSEKVVEAR